jgi:hypothetical protein
MVRMAGFVIRLGPDYTRELLEIARYEYRDPRMQAKLLLETAIRERSGSLPADHPAAPDPGPSAALEALKT